MIHPNRSAEINKGVSMLLIVGLYEWAAKGGFDVFYFTTKIGILYNVCDMHRLSIYTAVSASGPLPFGVGLCSDSLYRWRLDYQKCIDIILSKVQTCYKMISNFCISFSWIHRLGKKRFVDDLLFNLMNCLALL
ncbi:hypothetical protein L6452_32642 [Arctium lappa]|uniref:Uncharacterized protein n=1 Tax=Arctium lappa TaxID=4217 RepID=A0ACB8Z5D0_ARCLA|nr:hypothetical protein L6452_32642 [Arctium lappa]